MAIVLNDTVTSDKTMEALPLQSVPEPLSSSGLEELPDEIQVLPFVEDDPCGEFGWREGCVRDYAKVNRVAVECWKTLRIPQTPKKREPQDLSLFPQMPIDILLEVVGHLHPIDLMHVARVNRAFRALLHAPSAEAIWRSAFIGRPPLPTCPPEISGRRWSKLLFGPRQCDECGAPDTSPDHKIWRRLCTDCMNWKLFNGVPSYSYSHEVNTLLARTFRNDGRSGTADSDVGRLWPADGTVVAQEYERIKAADAEARLRGDDSPGALEAFIEARKLAVQAVEERAEEAEAWSDKIFSDWVDLSSVRSKGVIRSACKRLIEEGHDPRDVPSEDDPLTPYLEHFPRLTSKRWNKARPHILPLVATARAARLEQERNELIVSRTTSAATAASHVLRTAPPQTWAYSPPKYTFETFAPLQALIKDPSDDPLSDDDPRLADALLGLPAFIEAWRAEKRTLLASLLPPPAEAECGSSDDSTPATPNRERLDLATSVFTCLGSWVGAMSVTAGRALIGWEAAGAHLRCRSLRSYWEHRPHFAPEGAAAAAALVRLVGLDPDTATAVQMDRLCGDGSIRARKSKAPDMRFLCTLCPLEMRRGVRGRAAMRWRECVQHTIERSRMHGGDDEHRGVAPAWALLTDVAAEDVRRREALDPVVWDSAWVCALCPAHYETRVTHAAAVEHLQSDHKIREPVEGKHFIYFVGAERTPRVPALLSQEGDVAELRCNMCSHGKLRALRGIRRHVTDKHKIPAPSTADWTRVERILRTTLPPPAEAVLGPVGA